MPSVADEKKHIAEWIVERVPVLDLEQLRGVQSLMTRYLEKGTSGPVLLDPPIR